jgi:hypothetical protein
MATNEVQIHPPDLDHRPVASNVEAFLLGVALGGIKTDPLIYEEQPKGVILTTYPTKPRLSQTLQVSLKDRNFGVIAIGEAREARLWAALMGTKSVRQLPFFEEMFLPELAQETAQPAEEITSPDSSDYNPFDPNDPRNKSAIDRALSDILKRAHF